MTTLVPKVGSEWLAFEAELAHLARSLISALWDAFDTCSTDVDPEARLVVVQKAQRFSSTRRTDFRGPVKERATPREWPKISMLVANEAVAEINSRLGLTSLTFT